MYFDLIKMKSTFCPLFCLSLNPRSLEGGGGGSNGPFQGFRRHLGGGAVAAKITANVWEIVQLSNLVTPLLYNGVLQKSYLLIGIDKDTVSAKQRE